MRVASPDERAADTWYRPTQFAAASLGSATNWRTRRTDERDELANTTNRRARRDTGTCDCSADTTDTRGARTDAERDDRLR